MRALLLFLSGQKHLRRWVETSKLARRLSSRFVAGHSLADALSVTKKLNAEGIMATIDYLGENVALLEEADQSRDAYIEILEQIAAHHLNANVSIKLTQFGLDLSEQRCRENVGQLVARAAGLGNFVRVDMESSAYTERTLQIVMDVHARYSNVGAVIQAYLYRSEKDVEALCSRRIRVRLCKGAYLEPAHLAYPRKAEVDRNFVHLMKILLTSGPYPAIATHDPAMIDETQRFAASEKISRQNFEFQMLYGIRRDIQKRLLADGYRLRLYVPFGEAWYPYLMRRLAERPANLMFALQNLLRR